MKGIARVLQGAAVRLLPLRAELEPRIVAAALAHPEVWRHIPYPMRTEAEIRERLAQAEVMQSSGAGVVYATEHRETGKIIGGTAIWTVDPRVPSFE
ncbi:MAG TPA: hypothetical protein VFQ35_12890, partial [Polyangiaceae bacterium]|nr:hypothetical protein [Polyangiaceae bacterium]